MKTLILNLSAAVIFGLGSTMAYCQTPIGTTTTTVTSAGTVSEFTPNAIAVKVDNSPAPVRYTFTKTTTYVDENGQPVSVETVRSGVPVEVYYEKNGDNLVADKIVVKKSVTTTTDASAPVEVASSTPPPPTVDGVVAEADSDDISIRTATSDGRVHYKAHDATAYVDESGNPVSRSSLKKGTPVTIYYERDGENLLATRVVVRNSAPMEKTTIRTEETTVPR